MSQILIFGDSITYGAWDMESGWAARLRKYVDQKNMSDPNYYYLVYNLGVSGNSSADILKRFEFEARQRIKEEGETIIIFALGTNDAQLFAGKFRTELEEFKANLRQLKELANKFTQKIIFIGEFPVDETKTCPVPWHEEKFYKNENTFKNNEIIKEFCQQNKLLFVDIYAKFINTDYKKLLEDGLHPNSKGHEKMFEIIKDDLTKNKII